ncbi:MAG: thiolase family protein [Oscillospiraceae bacterium]
MKQAVIVACCRSAVGKAPRGYFKDTRPENIAARVLQDTLARAGNFDASLVEDLMLGCSFPEAEQGFNLARSVALLSGLPESVPGQTINRFCSSGLQSIATAAYSIMVGQNEVLLAGGVETMSMISMTGTIFKPNPDLMALNPGTYISMGITAENVAEKYNLSRTELDEFALHSHEKAARARREGKFTDEIVPVLGDHAVAQADGSWTVEHKPLLQDEGIREGLTMEALSKLKPVFKKDGVVTAGNSSQTSDGAGCVLIMSDERAKSLGLKPLAAFRSFAVTGCSPAYMGLGPIAAIPKALKLAGLTQSDIELIEINEAFASQAVACIHELGLNPEIVNVNGGAIAMGHPLGATGSILTVKLLSELRRRGGRYGMVTMCIGGGMGAAGIYELL